MNGALQAIDELDEAFATSHRGDQLRLTLRAAAALGESFAAGPRIVAARSLPLTTLPYPTRYALGGAAFSPAPFVTMTHRALLVQHLHDGELRNLLFNPTDVEAARRTPFFERLGREVGERVSSWMARRFPPLEEQLAALGVAPEDIDLVAFDHFHTQDLRGLLGTLDGTKKPRFPNATLLAPRAEWDEWDALHPVQRAWFVEGGRDGVVRDKVAFTSRDLRLGDGVLLVRTPGHTSGNQTLFVNTPDGVWGVSENGTCADNWSPLESRIKGVAFTARMQELDVVLNSNTPELYARQYTSMMLERAMVGRVERAPGFCQMFSSSEVTPHPTAPGLRPTVIFGALSYGTVIAKRRR